MKTNKIAFQGQKGAYSDLACREMYPEMESLPCVDFASALKAVEDGEADLGMIPVDNSLAGRVAAVHQLLPETSLHIVGEYFLPVHHCLLGVKGTKIEDIKQIRSHLHALPQCRNLIRSLNVREYISGDTALAAKEVAEMKDPTIAAIASSYAAEIYGLDVLKANIEDAKHNTTRFLVVSQRADVPERRDDTKTLTTLLFRVRNIPSALYKAMGGFATNNVNMTKLESYMVEGEFEATQFYCDIEGHIDDRNVQLAIEELEFFAREVRILGVYPAAR